MKITLSILLITLTILASPLALAEADTVNINTANLSTLITLKRIGPKYAERIIQFRKDNGPFARIEDIQKVVGIGLKTFEANKERLIVTDPIPEKEKNLEDQPDAITKTETEVVE